MHSAKKKINVYPVLYALISGAVLVSAPMLATAQTASVTIGGPAVSATLALSPASGSHGTNNIFSVNQGRNELRNIFSVRVFVQHAEAEQLK